MYTFLFFFTAYGHFINGLYDHNLYSGIGRVNTNKLIRQNVINDNISGLY